MVQSYVLHSDLVWAALGFYRHYRLRLSNASKLDCLSFCSEIIVCPSWNEDSLLCRTAAVALPDGSGSFTGRQRQLYRTAAVKLPNGSGRANDAHPATVIASFADGKMKCYVWNYYGIHWAFIVIIGCVSAIQASLIAFDLHDNSARPS